MVRISKVRIGRESFKGRFMTKNRVNSSQARDLITWGIEFGHSETWLLLVLLYSYCQDFYISFETSKAPQHFPSYFYLEIIHSLPVLTQ